MHAVSGIYQNGKIKLDEEYLSDKPVKVIITFLEEAPSPAGNGHSFDDYSFAKSRQLLEKYKGSFGDTVIEERRSEL